MAFITLGNCRVSVQLTPGVFVRGSVNRTDHLCLPAENQEYSILA
jgi:hypothetical protein